MPRLPSVDLRAELGASQRNAGPGGVAGVATSFEHRVHLHRGSHHRVVAMLSELLPGALP